MGYFAKEKMDQNFLWILTFLLLVSTTTLADQYGSCNETLGLESGNIKDHDLTASSSFDDHSTGPHNARLNHDRLGGAWCPRQAIQEGIKEWIQVNLGKVHSITGIITQGRYGKGNGQEYLEHFMIEYRRPGLLSEWRLYTDKDGNQIFRGSRDTVTPIYANFDPPFLASQVRVIPFSKHPRVVCLRLELHGCSDTSGVAAYSSPPPDAAGSFNTSQYDEKGWWEEQTHGLLTDGAYGNQVIKLSNVPTYPDGWMSWKRKVSKPLEIVFKFDGPRNFSKVNIFSSNLFHLNVQVFRRAVVWFSIGGEHYINEPILYEYMPDKILEEPRNVSIRLDQRIGRYVKLQLFFTNTWISISEISFDSRPASGSHVAESAPTTEDVSADSFQPTTVAFSESPREKMNADAEVKEAGGTSEVEILIGVLTAVTLLLLFLFIVVLAYSRRQKLLNSPTSRSPFPVQINMKDMLMTASPNGSNIMSQLSGSPNNHVATDYFQSRDENNGLGAKTMASAASTAFYDQYCQPIGSTAQYEDSKIVLEEARSKWHSTGHVPEERYRGFYPNRTSLGTANVNPAGSSVVLCSEYASVDIQNLTGNNDNGNSPRFIVVNQQQQQQQQQLLQQQGGKPQLCVVRGNNGGAPVYNLGNYFPRVASEPPTRKSYHTSPRDRDMKLLPMAETLWNVTTTVQAFCKQPPATVSQLTEIPRGHLRMKESFGRGCLGEVLLCEADSDYSNVPQPVAVRSCPHNSIDILEREDFLRECRLLATLRHTNIVTLVGVSTADGPYCSVLEHSLHGDLYNYLRQLSRVTMPSSPPPATVPPSSSSNVGSTSSTSTTASTSSGISLTGPTSGSSASSSTISYTRILDMASQIAAGMKYLESRNIVHKDLAARNCLLCENRTVKITDVAMGISLFNSDYSEVRGRSCAPIRWQPWESILLGRVTTSSNVWTFGVTVWELLTLCRQRPFALLTDIEVVQNAEHAYYNDALQVELTKPEVCEKEVWEILEECWNRDEKLRPNFAEISLFLKRKSLTCDKDP